MHGSALVWIQLFASIAMCFGVCRVRSGCTCVLVKYICTLVQLSLCQRGLGFLGHTIS